MATLTPTTSEQDIDYPESDGKPMAETDTHRRAMMDTIQVLETFFRDRPEVYVSGNLLLYYQEGNPKAVVSPDVFVVFGVGKSERRIYKLWEEQKPPTVVIEITSRSTRREDSSKKRTLYATLEVPEYFLFDPLEEYLRPSLQGYRLENDAYMQLPYEVDGSLTSNALGLRLQREGTGLRLVDLATGERLLWPDEEAAARQSAEAELAQLRAELARLQREADGRS